MSLHATATFQGSVEGPEGPEGQQNAEDLEYHWSLDTERGTYLLDGDEESKEAVTTVSSLRLRGDRAGAETKGVIEHQEGLGIDVVAESHSGDRSLLLVIAPAGFLEVTQEGG